MNNVILGNSHLERIMQYVGLTEDDVSSMNTEEFVEVLTFSAVNAIHEQDADMFRDLIQLIGIDKLEVETINQTMLTYIMLAYNFNSDQMVNVIFNVFDSDSPVVDIRPSGTTFYTIVDPMIDIDLLKFVAMSNTDLSYGDHMYNLVNYGSDPGVDIALNRFEKIFGMPSVEFLDSMLNYLYKLDLIYDDTNLTVARYCIQHMKTNEDTDIAPRTNDIITSDILPSSTELLSLVDLVTSVTSNQQTKLLTVEDAVEVAIKNNRPLPSIQADIRKLITEDFETMDNNKVQEIMLEYMKVSNDVSLQKNKELFRIYGPSFPVVDLYCFDHKCKQYGGCRMLLCEGHVPRTDYDDDAECIDLDWFQGACTTCTRVIPSRHLAKRMPIPTGGWTSDTYCSWECVIKDIMEPDFIIEYIVKYLEKKCLKIGIYDRIDDGDINDNNTELYVPPGYFESLAGYPLSTQATII